MEKHICWALCSFCKHSLSLALDVVRMLFSKVCSFSPFVVWLYQSFEIQGLRDTAQWWSACRAFMRPSCDVQCCRGEASEPGSLEMRSSRFVLKPDQQEHDVRRNSPSLLISSSYPFRTPLNSPLSSKDGSLKHCMLVAERILTPVKLHSCR